MVAFERRLLEYVIVVVGAIRCWFLAWFRILFCL